MSIVEDFFAKLEDGQAETEHSAVPTAWALCLMHDYGYLFANLAERDGHKNLAVEVRRLTAELREITDQLED